MAFLSKYGEARTIQIPVIKRAVVDFAVSADWTPAAGDVKITKDGGAAANVTNLPTALTMGNTALWVFSITATEMQAARIEVTVADAATKAVEDTAFAIETYGNASAQHAFDLDTASSAQTGDSFARLGAPAGASVSADIAAIEAQTDDIGVAGAGLTAIPLGSVWNEDATGHQTQGTFGQVIGDSGADADTIWGLANTNLDATVSSRASSAALSTVQADTDDIQTRLPAALVSGRMDSSVGAYAAGMTPTRPSASGTADSGSTTTVVDTERTEADTDYWKGCLIKFTNGTLNGQTRLITAFDAATDTITFAPATTVAAATHTYEIYAMSRVDLHFWLGALVNALISGRVHSDPEAATIRSAVGLAAANLDTQLVTIDDFIDTEVSAIKAKTDALPEGIQKNATLNNFEFFMVDSADHVTGKTGLTITAERSIDGAAFVTMANSAVEVANGLYKINLAAADTNGDVISYKFTGTGADATIISFKTEA